MPSSVLATFAVVLACADAATADNRFLLGLDYSKPVGFGLTGPSSGILATATDGSGALYLLAATDANGLPATSVLGPFYAGTNYYVTKVTPQGDQVYLAVLGFAANGLAVDPGGNAYVTGATFVAKLNATGTAFLYKVDLGQGVNPGPIAVDPSGRAYVAGTAAASALQTTPNAFQPASREGGPFVARLNLNGSVGYATYVGTDPLNNGIAAIAVDATGAAVLLGVTDGLMPTTAGAYLQSAVAGGVMAFLAKLNPEGSGLVYSTLTGADIEQPNGLALDANGNAVVSVLAGYPNSRNVIKAFNADGTKLLWTRALPLTLSRNAMATDGAGNTYIVGITNLANVPVKNSLVSCGSVFLNVYGPSGEPQQSTFLPSQGLSSVGLTTAPDGAVYVVGNPDQPQTPGGRWLLLHLSQHPNATPLQLACVGNAGSYDPGPVAPGELVSLFGQGLGPADGAQPKVDLKKGFPNQLANVQVTFDGKPAPLLYVQDSQINAIAPWSLTVGATTEICVVYNSTKTNCLQRPVANAAPGVFTTDGTYAAALNQDGSLNSGSNPAKFGSMVSVFATGLGPISPAQPDGAIVRMPPPVNTLQWGVVNYFITLQTGPELTYMDVQYAGPAPFVVAGLSQINFKAAVTAFQSLQLVLGSIVSPPFYVWTVSQ